MKEGEGWEFRRLETAVSMTSAEGGVKDGRDPVKTERDIRS